MKKFYSVIALAVAVTLSANAEGRRAASTQKSLIKNVTIEQPVQCERDFSTTLKSRRAAQKSVAVADYAGEYAWDYAWLLNNDPYISTITIDIIDANTGQVAIDIEGFTFNGTVDVEAKTLTIPNKQYLGKDSYGDDVYFYVKDVASDGKVLDGASDVAATVGEISGNVVTFPSLDVWALGDLNQESLGWYILTCYNVFDKTVWNSIGQATVSGDFAFTFFNTTPTDYTVDAYLNGDGTIIRINDSLKGLYAAKGWGDDESPAAEFVVTDPDNVILNLYATGISGQTAGAYGMLSDSYNCELTGETPTAYITLTSDGSKSVITCEAQSLLMFTTTTKKLYYVNYESPVTITFNKDLSDALGGVDSVAADAINANAPVEFYNMQGQRITNPAAGQLVIRKQGTAVSKQIVR